jgi:hypothetical protein
MLIFDERHLHPVHAEYVAHDKARRPPTLLASGASVVAGMNASFGEAGAHPDHHAPSG